MDAVKFVKEYRRMCNQHADCVGCPIESIASKKQLYCRDFQIKFPDWFVNLVELWSREHPQKTRLDDLKEKFPNFILKEDGYPAPRPFVFGYCGKKACTDCSHFEKQIADLSPKHCWDLPVEDEK